MGLEATDNLELFSKRSFTVVVELLCLAELGGVTFLFNMRILGVEMWNANKSRQRRYVLGVI